LGILSVERVYPLTLGSNIGTTTTALLASLAVTGTAATFRASVQIALCHLFFNLTGILLFYPIPFMRLPIPMCKFLGDTTAKYRWFAILYMILMFVVLPGVFMGLSFAGTIPVIVVAAIVVILFVFICGVNLLRSKKPSLLPSFLLSWKWLPVWLRSLEPYDRFFTQYALCKKLRDKSRDTNNGTELSPSDEKLDRVDVHTNMKYGGNVNPAFTTE